ncbi:MAG: MliC family protein [bacterium]|nr:MliC family protein [bacterium]MBK7702509.1 MliC family protein [bacterium]MBK9304000.1 MliC family protein [bacterium]
MRRFSHLAILLPCALLTAASCAPGFGPCTSRTDVAAPERGPLHLLAIYGGVDRYYLADYEPGSPRALLYAPDGVQELTQQIAASGAKYAGGRYLLWTKGRDIRLEVDGQRVEGCEVSGGQEILERCWAEGYHFRASGDEPGWHLQTGPGGTRVTADYGALVLDFPGIPVEGLRDGAPILREAGGHVLRLRTAASPCFNDMSGEPYPLGVEMELDGRTLYGCGVILH